MPLILWDLESKSPDMLPCADTEVESTGVLEWIAIGGCNGVLLLFLARGVQFDFENPLDPNLPPLMFVAMYGNSPVVRTMLRQGAKISHRSPKTGWNMIRRSAFWNQRSFLIEAMHYTAQTGGSLDLDVEDLSGKTFLMIAEEQGNEDIANLLEDYITHSEGPAFGLDLRFTNRLKREVELDLALEG